MSNNIAIAPINEWLVSTDILLPGKTASEMVAHCRERLRAIRAEEKAVIAAPRSVIDVAVATYLQSFGA